MLIQEQRAVLEHVVEQHAEEAAFLWTLRDAATDAPHYKRHHRARLDERVEAHIDGLRVAGDAGWQVAKEQLEHRCEKGELFAAGVLALESGDKRRIDNIVATAIQEPAAGRGLVGAIAWCRADFLAPAVREWNASGEAFERYLALCACSVHRAEPGSMLERRLEDQDAIVRARALRLVGELGKSEYLIQCSLHFQDASRTVRYNACWSAVLVGDRASGLEALKKFAVDGQPGAAQELSLRALAASSIPTSLTFLHERSASQRSTIQAVGHVGDPAAVPVLLGCMNDPQLSRVAGESFSSITGADLVSDKLERDLTGEDGISLSQSESHLVQEIPADPDENLPWPDIDRVEEWWRRQSYRFKSGTRFLSGLSIAHQAAERIWLTGFQRQRRSAAFELSLSSPATGLRQWARREQH
jgi:uncharacterized protein (TIGR02270 family)